MLICSMPDPHATNDLMGKGLRTNMDGAKRCSPRTQSLALFFLLGLQCSHVLVWCHLFVPHAAVTARGTLQLQQLQPDGRQPPPFMAKHHNTNKGMYMQGGKRLGIFAFLQLSDDHSTLGTQNMQPRTSSLPNVKCKCSVSEQAHHV